MWDPTTASETSGTGITNRVRCRSSGGGSSSLTRSR